MFCKNCKSEIPDDSIFCQECGAKVERDDEGPKTCPKCGNAVEEGDLFCMACGEPLSGEERPEQIVPDKRIEEKVEEQPGEQPEPPAPPKRPEQSEQLIPPVPPKRPEQPEPPKLDSIPDKVTRTESQKDKKPDKSKVYLMISVAVVVVLGAVIIGRSVMSKKGSSAQAETGAVVSESSQIAETVLAETVPQTEPVYNADINGVENATCTVSGTVEGQVLVLDTAQSVYVYNESGTAVFFDSTSFFYIDNSPGLVNLEDYNGRKVLISGPIYAQGEQGYVQLKGIETTDGPLYDVTEGGIHRYEFVIKDCGWHQAYQESLQKGGYLIRINSAEEYNYILQEISARGYDNIHFYLGGRRDANSTDYYWVDKDNVTYGVKLNGDPEVWCYNEWMSGEPSYEDPQLQIDEPYLNIFYYSGENRWVWNDGPEDIPVTVPAFSQKVGFIVEYED